MMDKTIITKQHKELLKIIEQVWKQNPKLSFYQLLYQLGNLKLTSDNIYILELKDKELIKSLKLNLK